MIAAAIWGFFIIVAYCAYYLLAGVLYTIGAVFNAITGRRGRSINIAP